MQSILTTSSKPAGSGTPLEYTDLKLTGYLANTIRPWGLFAVPVELAVLDPDQTPYCVSSQTGN